MKVIITLDDGTVVEQIQVRNHPRPKDEPVGNEDDEGGDIYMDDNHVLLNSEVWSALRRASAMESGG